MADKDAGKMNSKTEELVFLANAIRESRRRRFNMQLYRTPHTKVFVAAETSIFSRFQTRGARTFIFSRHSRPQSYAVFFKCCDV